MTVAERITMALVLLAGLFAAWTFLRQGAVGLAVLAIGGATAVAVQQAIAWIRSKLRSPWVLEQRADGRLQARRGPGVAVPAFINAQTRLLGPSVFLDLTFATGGNGERYRGWITPFDAPAQPLRRWAVFLSSAGSRASG